MSHRVFGDDFVLAGVVADKAKKFRFEVWARHSPLPEQVIQQVFRTWQLADKKNRVRRGKTVQIQWLGDSLSL